MLLVTQMARAAVMAGTGASVAKRVSGRQAGRWAQQAVAPARPDALAQLKQVGELMASGVLTKAEFEALKAKILAGD